MKKTILFLFLIPFAVMIIWTNSAIAISYTFYDTDNGGITTAVMNLSLSGNVLTATLDNTSPVDLIGGSDGGNSPGITGFGFDVNPDSLVLNTWELKAYDSVGGSLVTIGSNSGGGEWSMGTSIGGISLDYLPNTFGGISGAIFNPEAFFDLNNTIISGSNTVYYSTAELVMTFADDVEILGLENVFVRMQNVGDDGSTKTFGDVTPVPEPATIMLLGVGLLGLTGGVSRKKFKRK